MQSDQTNETTQLETFASERIYLRRLQASDIDDHYVSWFDDEELVKFYSGTKRKFTREFLIEDLRKGEDTGTYFLYGIFTRDTNKCIGNIKVGPMIKDHKISDLIVIIGDRDYHGKGLAVEGIRLGNRVAFEKHDIRKLFGGMYLSNMSSIKAYTRADWVIEGRLKGHYWVDGKPMDRVLVACFNPKYFDMDEIRRKFSSELSPES